MTKKNEKKEERKEEAVLEPVSFSIKQPTELEHIHALLKELQERGIRSIGDLENQIEKLQR